MPLARELTIDRHPAAPRQPSPARLLEEARAVFERQHWGEAERLYRALLERGQASAECLYRLGVIQLRLGRPGDGASLLRRALEISPRSVGAHYHLGQALQAMGHPGPAIGHYEWALRHLPDWPEAHNNLGVALQAVDRPEAARTHYERALACRPAYAEAHNNLGTIHQAARRFPEAEACYRRAIEVKPDYAEAHYNLGNVFQAIGRCEEAVPLYRRALALRPDYAEAQNNLGTALVTLGRLPAARRAFERAIALCPARAGFYRNLVDAGRVTVDDPVLAEMAALAREEALLPTEERMQLHFALGKAEDDLGHPENAFRHWQKGNALKRRRLGYDEAAALAPLEEMARIVTREFVARWQGRGDPAPLPVFIIGMPRSGTTLVEQILASHPQVHGAGELPAFQDALAATAKGAAPGDFLSALAGDDLARLGRRYLDGIRDLAPAAPRVTDKLPANFLFAGLIHLALPGARIIHVRRDPVDTCLSCFSKLFTQGVDYAYDLGELGRYYRAYDALMRHWSAVLPSGAIIELGYEALVADLEGQSRRLIAACGLDWDAACLAFHRAQRPVRTASAAQVREPLYASAVGRAASYRALLAPLIEALGPDLAG